MPPNPCVDEHIAVGGTVATISTTDVDAGATFTYKVGTKYEVRSFLESSVILVLYVLCARLQAELPAVRIFPLQ